MINSFQVNKNHYKGNSKNCSKFWINSSAFFPTKFGNFNIKAYKEGRKENLVLIYNGTELKKEPPLVRIHSRCITGDVFSSLRCDCRQQLEDAIKKMVKEKNGIILYLDQEGRGIGLVNKINTYVLQDKGLDTIKANYQLGFKEDERKYKVAAKILKKLGVKKIRLLTNNPKKIKELKMNGIAIIKRIPLIVKPNQFNKKYLKTKKEKMGHLL